MSDSAFTRGQKTTGHLFALFTTLVWGSCFVLTKVMLRAFTPIQIIPLRMGLAYLALWALRPKILKLSCGTSCGSFLSALLAAAFTFSCKTPLRPTPLPPM